MYNIFTVLGAGQHEHKQNEVLTLLKTKYRFRYAHVITWVAGTSFRAVPWEVAFRASFPYQVDPFPEDPFPEVPFQVDPFLGAFQEAFVLAVPYQEVPLGASCREVLPCCWEEVSPPLGVSPASPT